jgi:hypothetical protein
MEAAASCPVDPSKVSGTASKATAPAKRHIFWVDFMCDVATAGPLIFKLSGPAWPEQ